MDMTNVLITGAGSDIGIGALQSLQDTDHKITAVDMNTHSAGLYMADNAATVPPATHDSWASSLAEIVAENDIQVVIPLIDDELAELDSLSRELPDDIRILTSRSEIVRQTLDKYETYKLLRKHDLAVPNTELLSEVNDLSAFEYPQFLKPRSGHGSRGTYIADSPRDVETFVTESDYTQSEMLLQEYLEGVEYTTNITATQANELLSIVVKEAPIKRGNTVWGVTREEPVVEQSCRRVFTALSPAGPMNVQQIRTKDDTVYTIEINPRFSGSSCLNVMAGVNEFDLLIQDALGESVEPVTEYENGLGVLRYIDQIYLREESLLDEW